MAGNDQVWSNQDSPRPQDETQRTRPDQEWSESRWFPSLLVLSVQSQDHRPVCIDDHVPITLAVCAEVINNHRPEILGRHLSVNRELIGFVAIEVSASGISGNNSVLGAQSW